MDKDDRIPAESHRRSAPTSEVVYHALRKEGQAELARPSSALFWSGLAAGLSMAFSLITQALLRSHLPDEAWTPLVSKLGYAVGFLIVILGRQQLFTENTLIVMIPLLAHRGYRMGLNVLRLWAVVLGANWLGGLAMAFVVARTKVLDDAARAGAMAIGLEALSQSIGSVVLGAIFAGWLIALMLWLLPFAETGRIWVIVIITYLVGLGGFAHVVAGSIDVMTLAFLGGASWTRVVGGYMMPTLIGNIVGGVLLVAVINHAQVVAGREKKREGPGN